jgi:hypothetical protein
MADKMADLAGPGIGDYAELARVLPEDYRSLLTPRQTQQAIFAAKDYIEQGLCRELNLQRVAVPLILGADSGVNDTLDRDGSRTPIGFHISNDHDQRPVDAQIVQAATKWKRVALRQFGCEPGEGICTDMRAGRKDYFLDHDHSCYVDQWGWEQVITGGQRTLGFLTGTVRRHPGLEPRHQAPPRAVLHGHPRHCSHAPAAARSRRPAQLLAVPLPPGHHQRRAAAIGRRRHRPVPDPHAPAPQSPPLAR